MISIEEDFESHKKLANSTKELLHLLGEDVEREGLLDTPNRVAKMYLEMTSGLRTPPPEVTMFDRGDNDQMITVLNLDYYSLCEHHMVPFYGRSHIGYVPRDKIVGLSKFGRILDWYAKRPQIQEQLTAQVANFIFEKVEPRGVIVVVEGTHMCMSMRGVKKQHHATITSAIRGNISKSEFFSILSLNNEE